jgi:hypothetical protein
MHPLWIRLPLLMPMQLLGRVSNLMDLLPDDELMDEVCLSLVSRPPSTHLFIIIDIYIFFGSVTCS